MPYVVMKGKLFVAKPGSYNSYTTLPQNARTYETYQEAEHDCCGNEDVMFMTFNFHLSSPKEGKHDQQESEGGKPCYLNKQQPR